MKITFFGLGLMGSRMAKRLVANGYDVFSVPHSKKNSDLKKEFVDLGGNIVSSYTEALRDSKVIISILQDDESVRDLYFKNEVYNNIEKDSVIIECTSCSSVALNEVAKKYAPKNITVFDAPVSGGIKGAQDGTLTIMCAGNKSIYEKIKPILSIMGNKIDLLSERPGNGKDIKAINQMLVASHKVASAEAILLANKLGLDIETVKKTITFSSGNHIMLDYDFDVMYKENEPKVAFSLANLTKDLNIAYNLADELDLPMLETLHKQYEKANKEYHKENFTSIWKLYKNQKWKD